MIGIDEVGRGAWAGPLLVCAVRMHEPVIGLKDSKKLSAKRRSVLASELYASADIGYGWVSAAEIDELGLSMALRLATKIAIEAVSPQENEKIIIDGTVNFAPQYSNVETVIRADDMYPAVSAASIVAKVARDEYMVKLAKEFPLYGFERNVGYGTAFHADMLRRYGVCSEHRVSFKLPT